MTGITQAEHDAVEAYAKKMVKQLLTGMPILDQLITSHFENLDFERPVSFKVWTAKLFSLVSKANQNKALQSRLASMMLKLNALANEYFKARGHGADYDSRSG